MGSRRSAILVGSELDHLLHEGMQRGYGKYIHKYGFSILRQYIFWSYWFKSSRKTVQRKTQLFCKISPFMSAWPRIYTPFIFRHMKRTPTNESKSGWNTVQKKHNHFTGFPGDPRQPVGHSCKLRSRRPLTPLWGWLQYMLCKSITGTVTRCTSSSCSSTSSL